LRKYPIVSSDSLVRDPSLYKSLDEMAENLRLSQKFIMDLDSSLAPITQGFPEVTASTDETLKEIQKLMMRLESVTANNRYELHQLLKESRKTSESMRNLTDYLQRDPSSPFYGKQKLEINVIKVSAGCQIIFKCAVIFTSSFIKNNNHK